MRISDWSSDVCSSDLLVHADVLRDRAGNLRLLQPVEGRQLDRRIADTALVLVGILEEQAVVAGQIEIVVARVQVAVAVDREDRRTACRQIDAAELAALRTAHLVAVVARQPWVLEPDRKSTRL